MSFTDYSGTLCDWNPTTEVEDGPQRKTYPFEGSTEHYFEQDYLQLRSAHVAGQLDIEHASERGFYLVRQSPPVPAGGSLCRFTRTWSPIFSPRREMEPFAYTVPGISGGEEEVSQKYIASAYVSNGKHYITTTEDHGFSAPAGATAGTSIIIRFYEASIGWLLTVYREVLEVPSTTQFVVWLVSSSGSMTWEDAYKNYTAREPRARVVPSFVHFDYWLPGVSVGIATVNDIDILQPVKIIDNTGNETDSYSLTTVPRLAEYQAQIARQEYIVAEPSNLKRLMGNLYERATRYTVAV